MADDGLSFGLSAEILEWLRTVFARYPGIERVLVFGSRAKGTYRNASDIDLAVLAPGMDEKTFAQLWNDLDDLPLVFTLDVLHWDRLPAGRIRDHVIRDGRQVYPVAEPVRMPGAPSSLAEPVPGPDG